MHHSDFELRILAEQRSSDLIARAQLLNQLHDVRSRRRRKYFRSLPTRFRRPAPDRTVVDLREPPSPEPAPNPATATNKTEGPTVTLHTVRRS
jgi:hypothetical protein